MRTGADPYVPGHGDLTYDVTHYDLELAYSLDGNRLDGTARLDCTIREDTDELGPRPPRPRRHQGRAWTAPR